MKKLLIPVLFLVLVITACTTAKVTPADPATGTPAVTNYVVDPRLTSALDTAKGVVAVTAPVNPYAGLLDLGLGTVAAVATWFAKKKNDKANASTLLAKTIVQAIDQQDSDTVKAAIQTHAARVGVEGELNTFVKQVGAGTI